jgi:hypothetical protein
LNPSGSLVSLVVCEFISPSSRTRGLKRGGGYHKPMGDLGKLLIFLGFLLVLAGVVLVLLGRAHLPLGKLPGDIIYRGKNTTFYFPLATSILVSIVLSLFLYVVSRWRR